MSSRPDLRDSARDDERRRRDEARVLALQQQVDELRGIVRDLTSRQVRNEDQFRQFEGGLSSVRSGSEQHRHEVSQSLQARQLEDARFRQALTELDARIDESVRPVRSLQAHVNEILETMRRGRDDTDVDDRRYEELRVIIEHVAALTERNSSVIQTTRDSIEHVRTTIDALQKDIQRVDDSVHILEQELRRRVAEVDQLVRNLASRVDDDRGMFGQLDAQIDQVRASLVHIDPALEELKQVDVRVQDEILRFVDQSNERDDLVSERLDELRRHLDTQLRDVRALDEQRHDRITARVDGQVDVDRELAFRLSALDLRIDDVRDLWVRLRREVWNLHEARARLHLEQAQHEMEVVTDARRGAEGEASGERGGSSDRSGNGGAR